MAPSGGMLLLCSRCLWSMPPQQPYILLRQLCRCVLTCIYAVAGRLPVVMDQLLNALLSEGLGLRVGLHAAGGGNLALDGNG